MWHGHPAHVWRFLRTTGILPGGHSQVVGHRQDAHAIMNKDFDARLAALGMRSAEIEERFILGSGRGGQKLQKTSSCVWLRHIPTGMAVRCQRERSQTVNRELAWAELCAKLEERDRAAATARQTERAKVQRRNRQKSRGQKARMIQSKKHRAGIKSSRGRVGED